jgi:hypothetical protein
MPVLKTEVTNDFLGKRRLLRTSDTSISTLLFFLKIFYQEGKEMVRVHKNYPSHFNKCSSVQVLANKDQSKFDAMYFETILDHSD